MPAWPRRSAPLSYMSGYPPTSPSTPLCRAPYPSDTSAALKLKGDSLAVFRIPLQALHIAPSFALVPSSAIEEVSQDEQTSEDVSRVSVKVVLLVPASA